MTSATTARLQELLDLKDSQLAALKREADTLRHQVELGLDWMLQRTCPAAEDGLPVPRVELRLHYRDGLYEECQVLMVLARPGDTEHTRIPLAYSKRSGSTFRAEHFPLKGKLSEALVNRLPGLLDEACFTAEHAGMPAYVVLDGERRYQVTAFQPRVLEAVQAEQASKAIGA
jgi:hypothetical protein